MLFLAGLLGLMAIGSIAFAMSMLEKAEDRRIDPAGDNADEGNPLARDAQTDAEAGVVLANPQGAEKIDSSGCDDNTFLINLAEMITPNKQTTSVEISDWNIDGQTTKMMDYNTNLDSLILIWDEDAEQDPDVKVIKDAENPNLAHVMLNGRILADVNGGGDLSASDIVLVPQSTALAASANPTLAALFNAA